MECFSRMVRRQKVPNGLNGSQSPVNRARVLDDSRAEGFSVETKAEPKLERNLNLASLIFLCVSNSIGSGVFVLTGQASADPNAGYINKKI